MNKKLLIAVLAIALLVGIASATIINHFGYTQITAGVMQPVRLNGNDWNVPTVYEPTVYGGETWYTPWQMLSNHGNIPIPIKLETTISPTDGITSEYQFHLNIDAASSPNTKWDRVVTVPAVATIDDITSLNFEYMLTVGEDGLSPYFVLELDTNDDGMADEWAVSWQDNDTPLNTWVTYAGISGREWHPGDGTTKTTFASVQSGFAGAELLAIKVAIGYWGNLKQTTAIVRNIMVNGSPAIDNGIILPAKSASTVEGHVYFQVCFNFPTMTVGTFTITTVVKPA